MLIYYVRHGDPIYNPDSLTPLGERQAEAVGKRLAMHGIDKIFSSTSNRAYQTAVPLSELLHKDIVQKEFLHEDMAWKYFSVPKGNGRNAWAFALPEYSQKFVQDAVYALGQKWYEHPDFAQGNFKEGIEYFSKNADEFMLSLGYEHNRSSHTYKAVNGNSDRVAIFAHEGMATVFLSQLLDIPYPLYATHFATCHTGLTVLEFAESGETIVPRILTLSNDSHIYKEGLPTKYANGMYL